MSKNRIDFWLWLEAAIDTCVNEWSLNIDKVCNLFSTYEIPKYIEREMDYLDRLSAPGIAQDLREVIESKGGSVYA